MDIITEERWKFCEALAETYRADSSLYRLDCEDIYLEVFAELKARRENEGRGPNWSCRCCGFSGEGFRTVKYEIHGEPTEYDVECPRCGSVKVSESPEEALSEAVSDRDAKAEEAERYKAAVEWILSGDADLTEFKKFSDELRRRAGIA